MLSTQNRFYQAKFLKQLCVTNIILLLISLSIILITSPAQGYELNIYAMYSPVLWIFVSLIIILTVVIFALSEYWKIQTFWKLSLFTILSLYASILLLPTIRGYYELATGGGSDVFAHLGWIYHILNTGQITSTEHGAIYPGSHILAAFSQEIAGIDSHIFVLAIPGLFTIISILSITIILRSSIKSSWIPIFPVLFTLPLVYMEATHRFFPYSFALLLIPLSLYSYCKLIGRSRVWPFVVILILVTLCITLYHPLPAIFLLIFIFAMVILDIIVAKNNIDYIGNVNFRINERFSPGFLNTRKMRFITFSGLLVLFLFFSYFFVIRNVSNLIDEVINNIFSSSGKASLVEKYVDVLAQELIAGIDFTYLITYIIKQFAIPLTYLFLGILCACYVFLSMKKKIWRYEIHFSFLILISIVFVFAMISGYFLVIEFIRSISPLLLISIILIPMVFSALCLYESKANVRKVSIILMSPILASLILLSIFTFLPSPFMSLPSNHMTLMDKEGLISFMEKTDKKIPVLLHSVGGGLNKFEMYYSELKNVNRPKKSYISNMLPDNYGYDSHSEVIDMLDHKEYYLFTREMFHRYHYAVPENRRDSLITYPNPERLKIDPSINLLYSNGEFETWWLRKY